jgi:hypothetical protein
MLLQSDGASFQRPLSALERAFYCKISQIFLQPVSRHSLSRGRCRQTPLQSASQLAKEPTT